MKNLVRRLLAPDTDYTMRVVIFMVAMGVVAYIVLVVDALLKRD